MPSAVQVHVRPVAAAVAVACKVHHSTAQRRTAYALTQHQSLNMILQQLLSSQNNIMAAENSCADR